MSAKNINFPELLLTGYDSSYSTIQKKKNHPISWSIRSSDPSDIRSSIRSNPTDNPINPKSAFSSIFTRLSANFPLIIGTYHFLDFRLSYEQFYKHRFNNQIITKETIFNIKHILVLAMLENCIIKINLWNICILEAIAKWKPLIYTTTPLIVILQLS